MSFAESRVEHLTRRQTHAAAALLFASKTHNMPVTTEEVQLYDEEALSVRETAAALRSAQTVGLAVYIPAGKTRGRPGGEVGGYWTPTQAAYGLAGLLEDRYLRERGEADE